MSAPKTYPLNAGGAAFDRATDLGDRDGLRIADRTAWPRFGLKGPGAGDWLRGAGFMLPDPNCLAEQKGLVVLRLGSNDITLLASDGGSGAIAALRARWVGAAGPKGFSSWREEAWAWLYLDGPTLDDTLARCCAVDLRPAAHPADRIAQTRFAHVDAVVLRQDAGADVLFDISATGAVLATLRHDGGHSA